MGRPRRAEGRAPWRLRDPLAGLPPAIFRAARRPGEESTPSSSAQAYPAPGLPAAHPRRSPGGRAARLAGASDPALYSRFFIDEVLSQNEGEKVSRAGTAPGAELHGTLTLAAPRRLASSCLCKADSLRGAAFA